MMNPKIVIVIILIFFIFYMIHNRQVQNKFTVRVSDLYPSTEKISLGETYDWPCTGCLDTQNRLKPYFKYNISHDRCIHNNSPNYVAKNNLESILAYTTDPSTTEYKTCANNLDTRYSGVVGRYVKIIRKTGTAGFKISSISVHPRDTTITPYTGSIYTNALVFTDTKVSYPTSIFNATTPQTFSTRDAADGFIIIDLKTDVNIGYIEIKHLTSEDASTLNGAVLYILSSITPLNDFSESARVVFESVLTPLSSTNTTNTRIIYTQNNIPASTTPYNESVIDNINYPCTGCYTSDNILYKNYKYNIPADGRCFKIKTDRVTKAQLDSAVLKTPGIDLDAYFLTCSANSSDDTRKSPAIGRYIRIQQSVSNAVVKLSMFKAYTVNDTKQTVFATPVDIHASPFKVGQVYADLLKESSTTNLETGIATDPSRSYIQIDLGQDLPIKEVLIAPSSADATALSLINCVLLLIKQDGTITYRESLTNTTIGI